MTKANLHRFLQAEPRRSEERIKNGEDDTKLSKAAHYEGAVVFTAHFYVTVLGPLRTRLSTPSQGFHLGATVVGCFSRTVNCRSQTTHPQTTTPKRPWNTATVAASLQIIRTALYTVGTGTVSLSVVIVLVL
jgi:hypothetical protein